MRIGILGFAREGRSLLSFLRKNPKFHDSEIWILDKRRTVSVPRGIKKNLGGRYLKQLSKFDLVFRSPGVPYNLPELQAARRKGVKFSSATKLFFESASRRTPNVIGVTGTKGKGTTSTLLYRLLKAGGFRATLGGNIGTSPLDLLPKLQKNSWVILELSSFQLQDLAESPHIAVILDIFPDHQDAHENLREYYAAKANIARYQGKKGLVFYFNDNRLSRAAARYGRGKKIGVRAKKGGLFAPGDVRIPGLHNFRNALMAAAVARRLGIGPRIAKRVVRRFEGLEHRLEFVRKIGNARFYNDSASTNPHTAAAALRSFQNGTQILIAGGQDKGLNYAPLAKALKETLTRLAVLFGENKKKIKRSCAAVRVPVRPATGLRSAVREALSAARKQKGSSNIVFSPGAASFDMFENYADRGKQFKKMVLSIKKR